jgi:hypothetical protein
MSSAAALHALAQQFSSAADGSWELDCAFLGLFGWKFPADGFQVDTNGKTRISPEEHCCPTRRLDDALLFAHPPGHADWTWKIEGRVDGDPSHSWHKSEITVPSSEFSAFGHKSPLAMCAAICRMLADPRIARFVDHYSTPKNRG